MLFVSGNSGSVVACCPGITNTSTLEAFVASSKKGGEADLPFAESGCSGSS